MSDKVNKNSQKSQRHKDKHQAKRFVFELYATDDDERTLIELLEKAKSNNHSVKNIIKQSLVDYFEKNKNI